MGRVCSQKVIYKGVFATFFFIKNFLAHKHFKGGCIIAFYSPKESYYWFLALETFGWNLEDYQTKYFIYHHTIQ